MLKLGEVTISLDQTGDSFGIEKLKDISGDLLKALKKFKDRAKDGLTFWERIRTGLDFSSVGKEALKYLEDLKNEVLDLNEIEMAELAEHIRAELGLELNQSFESISKIIIESIDLILSAVSIYQNVKKLL